MTRDQLEQRYRRYIACLNERRIEEAAGFYADRLLYNGATIGRDRWRRAIVEEALDAMPDLRWNIECLIVDGVDLAARLRDTGTLLKRWMGLEPTGRPANFGENVFYRFRVDGLIDEVWSIVDIRSIA